MVNTITCQLAASVAQAAWRVLAPVHPQCVQGILRRFLLHFFKREVFDPIKKGKPCSRRSKQIITWGPRCCCQAPFNHQFKQEQQAVAAALHYGPRFINFQGRAPQAKPGLQGSLCERQGQ